MLSHRSLALGLTCLGLLGVSVGWAQRQGEPGRAIAPATRLDPGTTSIRLMLGVGDQARQDWSGQIRVDQGEVVSVEGYRFRAGDEVTGSSSWKARSLPIRKTAKKALAKKVAAKRQTGPGSAGPAITPTGVLVTFKGPSSATLSVESPQGPFQVRLADLEDGAAHPYLDGRVTAERIPNGITLLSSEEHEDFPAAAADSQGGVWVGFVAHEARGPNDLQAYQTRPKRFAELAPKEGGDQVRLFRFANGKPESVLNVTEPGLDVWRPAVAVDRDGKVIVVWSEFKENNWDLLRRDYDPRRSAWSEPKRLTTDPGTDTDVVLSRGPDGKVWMAWQAWREGQAEIFLADVENPGQPLNVSNHPANDWSPSLAVAKDGRIVIAFDSYRAGNYDALLWTGTASGGTLISVADSARYEARPTVALDAQGRAWVAYEERDAHWGKDAENLLDGKGSTLYRSAAVRVRCVEGDKVLEGPDPLANAPQALRRMNSYPRITSDRDGRIWLAFRHRQESIWGGPAVMVVGALWVEHVTSLDGKAWEIPQGLPRSDGLLDNRPALVPPSDGPVLAFYSTDNRLRREVEMNPAFNKRYWSHQGTPDEPVSCFNEDLQVASLTPWKQGGPIEPTPMGPRPAAEPVEAVPGHENEAEDVARMRSHRIQAGGKTYQLVRGDFHRHTELSMDGGSDGSLEDMWRYALDVAAFDWMGNADHDNGGGKEYTWWLAQKTTDLYTGEKFTGVFTYERSNSYPHGHRNVMFVQRGVRTLPRLVDPTGVVDEDTPMLYDYLKEHNGLCASHTSGTGMGTDWRDLNPTYEPIVEIFQGHRNSYEHLGAPRVARRAEEALGGWKPLGMVWNALAMQYKVGFEASSDHISTHISYAIALAENNSREAIFDAFKRRHCYGATDNILLDVRSGEHLMGDEFSTKGPVRLRIKARGTGPIARVDIIKDFRYAFSTEPNTAEVAFEWQDDEKREPGLSWYYVRVLQTNGELAWGSPFWIHLKK